MNLGLDLPHEDNPPIYVDDDSDEADDAFEIGIANANKKSLNNYNFLQDEESLDSFAKPSNRDKVEPVVQEVVSDFGMSDFMNP